MINRPSLLIAEDDRLIRESMRMALRGTFDVKVANDGNAAVDLFTKEGADAVLLDATMPGISGFEACRRIRGLPGGATVPIIIATSLEDNNAVDQAFEAGASDFLLKPLHLGVVGRKLQHLVRRDQAIAVPVDTIPLSSIPVPIMRLCSNLMVTLVNEAFCRAFRLDAKTLLGRKWTAFTDCDEKGFEAARTSPERSSNFKAEVLGIDAVLRAAHMGNGGYIVFANPEAPVTSTEGARLEPADEGALEGLRILILEDQDLVARSLMRLLGRTKGKITLASSGDEAVAAVKSAKAQNLPFGVLLLDLSIAGGKGGAEALQEIRALDPDVPAIATSGMWKDPVMLNPTAHGFDAVLQKPFAREDLIDRITSVIGKKAVQ